MFTLAFASGVIHPLAPMSRNSASSNPPADSVNSPILLSRRALVGSAILGLAGCGGGGESAAPAAAVSTPPTVQSPPPPTPSAPPPAPTPTPTTPSPPSPPADPEAPSVSVDSRVVLQQLNLASLVIFKTYHQDSRYERYRRLLVFRGDRATVAFHGYSLVGGGVPQQLQGSRYQLLVDGQVASSVSVAAGAREATFEVDLTAISAGWHKLEIGGLTGTETSPTWFAYKVGATATASAEEYVPVVRGTYELTQRTDAMHAYALAPSRYSPTARPLGRREYPFFASVLPRREMNCSQLVPMRFGDVHRPNVNQDGILSTFDVQPYFWDDMVRPMPRLALLDGPRGVGTLSMTTHVELGRAAPNGVPRNNLYVCDPWRVSKVSEDGTIKTLVGYRHRSMPSYWQEPARVDLVGDWSTIPPDRRGFHELWGMAWDERTLGINESAAPIAAEGGEKPHLTGPTMFVTDSQHNRVCKIEFSATSHATEPRVTEFITASQDAWDIVYSAGVIYVSERTAHRIAAYDASTGVYLRTVVQGPALATVTRSRFVQRNASLATIQAEDCVAPEGLYKLADDPWLYYGSVAMAQVHRVHLATGEVQLVCDVPTNGNSNYFKIAVSDGTFGPRGTVFVWSWQNGQYGWPFTWLPLGSTYTNGRQEWKWYEEAQVAGQWGGFVYATAGAVGQGRLVCGGANEGLQVISRRLAGDRVRSLASDRGGREFKSRGLNLLHGENGFGFYGLPLPWGVSANLDAFLDLQGHTR